MTTIVVGVDGGGTATRVIVADENGEQVGSARGPAAAVRPSQAERSAAAIARTVQDALASCAMEHVRPRVLCVGVAGVGREPEREALWQALAARDLAEEVVVQADAAVALDDAFGDGPGILLIAGTGSIAYGRAPAGRTERCGGWGPVCGDEGSGYWIGRRALSVATAASDGREPPTALVGALLTAAEVGDAAALIPWAASASAADIAALAPVVLREAESGDLRANALVALAAEELIIHLRTLARELFGDERAACPVALAGGLMAPGGTLRRRVELRLPAAVPGAQLRTEEVIPARGAVRGALRLLATATTG